MMRNTTVDLPDELVRHVESYAARNGTTMTALIRDNLERITNYRPEVARSDDPLVAFSEGRLSRQEAIRSLGLRDHAQLLMALGERGLLQPALPRHEVDAMADTFVRLAGQTRE